MYCRFILSHRISIEPLAECSIDILWIFKNKWLEFGHPEVLYGSPELGSRMVLSEGHPVTLKLELFGLNLDTKLKYVK